MRVGVIGVYTEVGIKLVSSGGVPITDVTRKEVLRSKPDVVIYCADCEIKSGVDYAAACRTVRWFYDIADLNIPTVLVSSEEVFGKKKWFGHRERDKQFPTTPRGLVKLGEEAVAHLFPNSKIVRGTDTDAIMRFALRFSEMPKILHIAQKPTILNTKLAHKLGIL